MMSSNEMVVTQPGGSFRSSKGKSSPLLAAQPLLRAVDDDDLGLDLAEDSQHRDHRQAQSHHDGNDGDDDDHRHEHHHPIDTRRPPTQWYKSARLFAYVDALYAIAAAILMDPTTDVEAPEAATSSNGTSTNGTGPNDDLFGAVSLLLQGGENNGDNGNYWASVSAQTALRVAVLWFGINVVFLCWVQHVLLFRLLIGHRLNCAFVTCALALTLMPCVFPFATGIMFNEIIVWTTDINVSDEYILAIASCPGIFTVLMYVARRASSATLPSRHSS
jgi:hypothetical protein